MRAHTLPLRSSGARCQPYPSKRAPLASPTACFAAQRLGSAPQPSVAPHEEVDIKGVVRASVVAAVALSLVAAPKAAYAEARPWKPRRHYRRMGERISDTWAQEAVEIEESLRDRAWEQRELERRLKLQREEEEFEKMKKEQELRLKRAEQIMTHVENSRSKPVAIKIGGLDVLPYLFWGSIVTVVLWASRSIWQRTQQRQRGPGKWVYDRSLGGKKVWVPDVTAPGSDNAVRVRTEEFERLASVAAAARQKEERANQVPGMPAWWNLPPTSFASPEVKASKQVEADRLLARIEQAKNRGEDYSLRDILLLRAICQEGGVSVKTKTVGARDGIYQTAIDAAIKFAQDHSNTANNIGDQESEFPESRLLTGLAGDLNMPEDRAVTLVRQAVAATCRARLLDAVRLLKESNEMDALVALMHMSALIQNIPALTEATKEPELIASSLQSTSTVDDRRKIFYILGQLQMEGANLFAEMLGFEPSLVVPKLYADVESYRQQQRAAEASAM